MGELLDIGPLFLADDRARVQPARLSALAEEALAVGAGTPEWQKISALLLQLRDALVAAQPAAELRSRYSKTLEALQAEVRKGAIQPAASIRRSGLRSAWTEEVGARKQ